MQCELIVNKVNQSCKLFVFISCYVFSSISFAASSMSGMTVKGYLDDNDVIDKIQCENISKPSYNCVIKLDSGFSKKIVVKNNNDCSDFSINSGDKGDIVFSCGVWGENDVYYYKYSQNNWYLYKHTREVLPMNGPNDLGSFNTYENFSKKWSIDSDLKDVNKDREKCK
ncbi:hypothetical protein [Vibrio gazogenes]|uniref:Uncharacterized protein n=1 Tax=Vibrio gazogenes TaxID=687 RepID=A0A1Z2SIF8_VIBGA|nr:hypothetical protein [Vibrio gazogenes]ASA56963.1 hypothetical protein BSQ33_15500 [Vibrio gazogenes]